MAQVNVIIGGRPFRLACNPGEEEHLTALAATVDEKIRAMRASFGEIGDQRLMVMAALTIADEALEARRAVEREHARAEAAVADAEQARQSADLSAQSLARALDEMSFRVESLTTSLAGGVRE